MQYTTDGNSVALPLVTTLTPSSVRPPSFVLTGTQRKRLLAARVAWQEGEGHLEHLAELSRHQAALARLRPLWNSLRDADIADALSVLNLALPRVRALVGNSALNRSRANPRFGAALRELLFGDEDLSVRLEAFLIHTGVGPRSAADLLYVAFPDRFPRLSPALAHVLDLSAEQEVQARQVQQERYQLVDGEVGRQTLSLLADFAIYEEARRVLGVATFAELDAVVRHAPLLSADDLADVVATATDTVQETGSVYVSVEATLLPAAEDSKTEPTELDLLRLIEAQVAAKGFTFEPLTVANYYIALKAKPFVILTGLSGTGKTRLTRLVADAITGSNDDQYLLLPVRPDWTDGTALFGYYNPLSNRYLGTPLVQLLQAAMQPENRDRAFFVCLDEMNLARVEHYFADALSAMETEDARIRLHEGRFVALGPNVFLTGSVNQDEATFPFSRKVLDRANTIEFAQVRLGAALSGETVRQVLPDVSPPERQRLFLENAVRTRQEAEAKLAALDATFAPHIVTVLSDLNDRLTPRGLQFGYRVRDEVLRYCAAAFTGSGHGLLCVDTADNLRTALDLQILQKILPRLSGTDDVLAGLLRTLSDWAEQQGFTRSMTKLLAMRARATEEGIVSFYAL